MPGACGAATVPRIEAMFVAWSSAQQAVFPIATIKFGAAMKKGQTSDFEVAGLA